MNASGVRSQPFWSSRSRAEQIVKTVPAYAGFEIVSVDWDAFRDRWLPGLGTDGLLVGVNWSGEQAQGYDIEPERIRANVEACMASPDGGPSRG